MRKDLPALRSFPRNEKAGATRVNVYPFAHKAIPGGDETLVLGNTDDHNCLDRPRSHRGSPAGWGFAGRRANKGIASADTRRSESGTVPGTVEWIGGSRSRPFPASHGVQAQAEFQIDITNRASAALTNVVVLDRFGSGLRGAVRGLGPIRRSIGTIGPSETKSMRLTFTVPRGGTTSVIH